MLTWCNGAVIAGTPENGIEGERTVNVANPAAGEIAAIPRFALDRSDPAPLYAQVAEQMESLILSGQLVPGHRLPAEIDLAADIGVSRATVRRAIQRLAARGFLLRRHGVGTQIVTHYRRRSRPLTSLHDELSRENRQPRTKVLKAGSIPADEDVARSFNMPIGGRVFSLVRLRMAADVPVALMHNTLPSAMLDLSVAELESQGLYETLRARRIAMRVAEQSITAVAADANQAALLDVVVGAPLLRMDTRTFTDEGDCIDIAHHFYRPDQYVFRMTNQQ